MWLRWLDGNTSVRTLDSSEDEGRGKVKEGIGISEGKGRRRRGPYSHISPFSLSM